MDDIEVWLRTDLVRLDFYILCGGCGKADVPRTGLEACGRGSTSTMVGWRREGGSSAKLIFLPNMWTLVVLALAQPLSHTALYRCLTSVETREPSFHHS